MQKKQEEEEEGEEKVENNTVRQVTTPAGLWPPHAPIPNIPPIKEKKSAGKEEEKETGR